MLDGKVVIVTGAARGIGQEYARACASAGAKVVATDINDCGQTLDSVKAAGGDAIAVKVNVSDIQATDAMVAAAIKAYGRVDGLINNAALYAPLPTLKVEEIDVELWDRVMAINIRGPFLMVKHVAPHMIARKYGKIVNIGSGTVARGIPNFSHYVTSKGAVTAFTRSISRELGDHGICVNTLAPGYTLSETGLRNVTHVASRKRRPSSAARLRDEYPEDLIGTLIYSVSLKRFRHRPSARGRWRREQHLRLTGP